MEDILIEVFLEEDNKRTKLDIDTAVLYKMGSLEFIYTNLHNEVLKTVAVLIRSQLAKEIKNSRFAIQSEEIPCISKRKLNALTKNVQELLNNVVNETRGVIVTSGDKAVDFYYTECCSGGTSNSEDLLGFRINYLRRVLCEKCSTISTIKKVNIHEVASENNYKNNIGFQETLGSLFNFIDRDATGRIKQVDFLGDRLTGEEFSQLFKVDSNRIYFMNDSIFIKAQGKGLGLGICIEGGNKLANEGKNYIEIIKYYYTGVELDKLSAYGKENTLKDKVIVIDPGHGGSEDGNVNNEIKEKNANLYIGLLCSEMLINKGAQVKLTREKDENLSLFDRVSLINKIRPDIFISIHQNSFMSPGVNGVEGYYYPRDEEALAVGRLMIRVISEQLGLKERGMKEGDYFILREAKVSGVILECMYLSGNRDFTKYTEDNYKKLARAIYESICLYYDVNP